MLLVSSFTLFASCSRSREVVWRLNSNSSVCASSVSPSSPSSPTPSTTPSKKQWTGASAPLYASTAARTPSALSLHTHSPKQAPKQGPRPQQPSFPGKNTRKTGSGRASCGAKRAAGVPGRAGSGSHRVPSPKTRRSKDHSFGLWSFLAFCAPLLFLASFISPFLTVYMHSTPALSLISYLICRRVALHLPY